MGGTLDADTSPLQGFSSKIPSYNPTDVYKNVKRYIDGESFEPMVPWYRGFTGTIKDDGDGKWAVEGLYTERGDDIIIEELPMGGRSFMAAAAFYSSEKSPVRLIEARKHVRESV